jgi:hypothetical protein
MDGTVILFKDSFITTDSVVGFLAGEPFSRVALAQSEVKTIEVRGDTTPRAVRIAGEVYLGVLAGLGIALAVTAIMLEIAMNRPHR